MAAVDHLVVMAASLDEGVQWCEATLGITPGPGGEHPLMGTHNRLFKITSPAFPAAYFEIIAINPAATPTRPPGSRRWFDMDDPALRARIARDGPQLVHFVASVPDAPAAVAVLQAQGLARGEVLQASRPTSAGLLQWQITVREDGERLFDGCLPTLIQWGPTHPVQGMPESGVHLQSLALTHPQADALSNAYRAIGLSSVAVYSGPARLTAQLHTPKGAVTLHSSPLLN
jgi:hypothetical protein